MFKPRVSTITPCFRMKRYLYKFLEELPQQTIFDSLEVVLDHNEPEAEELQWVSDFQRKYPGHLRHIVVDKVDPIGVSMNRCIQNAGAPLLAIWNVDDLRTPNSLEMQAKLLDSNSEYDFANGNWIIVKSFGARDGKYVEDHRFGASEHTRSMALGPFFMFRKRLCDKTGYFDEQLRSGADFDLAVRLAFHGKGITTKEILGYYLNEGLGASTRPNSLQPVERVVIELRYGIYDKINYNYLPQAASYNIPYLLYNGTWQHIRELVPGYDDLLVQRRKAWFSKGIKRYYWQLEKEKSVLSKLMRYAKKTGKKILGKSK